MPIDIEYFKNEKLREILTESQESRYDTREVNVDTIIDPESKSTKKVKLITAIQILYQHWKEEQHKLECERAKFSELSKKLGEKIKQNENVDEERKKVLEIKASNQDLEKSTPILKKELTRLLSMVCIQFILK